MKKGFVIIVGLMLLVLSACGNSSSSSGSGSDDKKVIRVGTTAQSFPNGYVEDGKLVGFDVEVFEHIAKDLGYKVEWEKTDFAGLMGQLETGRIDTIANFVALTPERAKKYYFSDSYAYSGCTIVTSKENDDINSLDDLKGKTVSGVLGSNNIENLKEFDSSIKPKTYETRDGAMKDAIKNRVAGYVNSKPSLIAEINKGKFPLKFVGEPFEYEKIAFPFVKNEDGKKLREKFNAEIQKLREDGTLKKISEKYFAGEDITVKK
ncbi:amino acid ABC transporter substrate-binding protein (PAAT family) [Scopulibacillus darangshiensis]|uniref:Amino acid ABC transporter substrate-binding protein (PAAT family) n=1 Tax=Scopulibacillus darangshiensis TaxID=442528 RepID=A0A4R2NPT8_9BACL|nr:amino acid ABC transporter substrate-binding protein [Scopulibacillus darangshiensis]TCP23767.1 amino acid ABC transporter substrate-binding protein (PAAT family) [Scopulibacillus darangshiensis]